MDVMAFPEAILVLQEEFYKIIQGFSIIDENDPMTSEKLLTLKQWMDSYTATVKEAIFKHEKYLDEHQKRNKSFLLKYQQKIKTLSDSLNKNLKNITRDHIEACQKLKQKIEVAKKDTNYRIEQLEVELEYFLATSDQNKIILNNDYIEAKKRFDYHREEAKESYLEIVKKNNKILTNIKEEIIQNYESNRVEIVKNQAEELERLQKTLEQQESELASITAILENERSNMKEKYRHESANLNDNIKRISEEKNKLIDKARGQYTKSMSDANIEKENKKVQYQTQAQALLKEFVTKINIIDENTSVIRKDFDRKIKQIKREYYSDVFIKTKEFHKQLEQIYTSSSSPLDKYTHHLIRFKNKQHQFNIHMAKKEKELLLLELSKDNTIKILNNRYDKNFLEIDKNYAIKSLTDQEQFDNKYYQENDNIFENDFNYTVKAANYRFSQQANLLRCQSQIRTKLLERNFDGISANYYKKIEAIQSKIMASKVTIDITKRLNQTLLSYLEETYHARLHLEETSSLLEIEKNKLLKGYNQSQYEHNISNISLAKDYGFKKIELENQKATDNKDLRIILENLILDKNCASTAFSIKKEELNENFAKIKTQIINNNDLKVSKEAYITNLLENDIHYLEQIMISFTHLFDDLKKSYQTMLKAILEETNIDENNYHYISSIINSILKLYIDFYKNMIVESSSIILDTLHNKMNYIYEFKYKESLDALEEQHTKDVEYINAKKNEIVDKIDSADKTIENFRQKIFTLINDNEMLIYNTQVKKKKLDPAMQITLKQTELKIKDYKEKIEDFNQMNRMHSDDLIELNQKLLKMNHDYKIELQKIQKMIKTDIYIYRQYQSNLEKAIKHPMINFDHMQDKLQHSVHAKAFQKNLHCFKKSLDSSINSTKTILLQTYNQFVRASTKDTEKRELACTIDFKNDVNSFNEKYNKATLDYLSEYHTSIAAHEKKIVEQTSLLEQMMKIYNRKLELAKENFQNDSNTLEFIQQQITNEFYMSYYALDDNHQKIIQFHQNLNLKKKEEYQLNKDNLNKERSDKFNDLNAKLKTFIKIKNEEIEHLPIAFKFNSKLLNRETKKKNIELHEDLKQAKTDYTNQNKHIEKNMKNLRNHLSQDQFQNEVNQKRSILKEKKNNTINLKQSLRGIKINL